MEPVRTAPSLDIDLYRPEVWDNPWPILERIREAGSIVWNKRGYWMSARDRTCRQIMVSPKKISQEGVVSAFFGPEAFISIDDAPLHNALRNVWTSAFGRDGVASLVPYVRQIADEMLDAVEGELRVGGSVDLMAKLCRPLPAYVIARMLGVPEDMIASIILWSDLMADATSGGFPIDYDNDPAWLAGEAAKAQLGDFISEQITLRRQSPGPDLISKLVQSEIAAELSDYALMMNARQLLFAGNETTAKWLGHVLVTLAMRADVRAELVADRSLIRPAAEEILRWQGVTQALPRNVVVEDAVVDGVQLKKGDEVVLLLGAAGRDPERYTDPEVLDIHRNGRPHLGFGYGMHTCLGAVLARMEVEQVVSAVLDRFPDFSMAKPADYCGFSLRGPIHTWIELPNN